MKKIFIVIIVSLFLSCVDPVGYSHFYIYNNSEDSVIIKIEISKIEEIRTFTIPSKVTKEIYVSMGMASGGDPSSNIGTIIFFSEDDNFLTSYNGSDRSLWQHETIQHANTGYGLFSTVEAGIEHYTFNYK